MGDLRFTEGQSSTGFANPVLSSLDGSPEPVVRELIQNSLDACTEIGVSPIEVTFTIDRVPRRDIPGINSYEAAFRFAEQTRLDLNQDKLPMEDAKVIAEIKTVLDRPTIPVLFCRDNGCGLDQQRMSNLLNQGNTSKTETGAGSFGLGHLTAFAASSMRYVLYGGKSWTGNGILRLDSGHAILASHQEDLEQPIYTSDGFFVDDFRPDIRDPFRFCDQPQPFLDREMNQIEETGTVVAIVGFNDFRLNDDTTTPAKEIVRVAAGNFLPSIWEERMVVTVEDWNRGTNQVLDKDRLHQVMEDEYRDEQQ